MKTGRKNYDEDEGCDSLVHTHYESLTAIPQWRTDTLGKT